MNEFIVFLKESLNTSFKITKTEKGKYGVDLYYLNVNNKEYRIFIERSDKSLHIGFERNLNGWEVTPITNDLTIKEIMGLFGTIKIIIENQTFDSIWIETDNAKKHQLYFNMMSKLNKDLKFSISRDDKSVLLYGGDYNPSISNKFKYKKIHKY